MQYALFDRIQHFRGTGRKQLHNMPNVVTTNLIYKELNIMNNLKTISTHSLVNQSIAIKLNRIQLCLYMQITYKLAENVRMT